MCRASIRGRHISNVEQQETHRPTFRIRCTNISAPIGEKQGQTGTETQKQQLKREEEREREREAKKNSRATYAHQYAHVYIQSQLQVTSTHISLF